MRLRRNRLKQYYLRPAETKRGREGDSYTEYGPASAFCVEIWPAGGKVQAELYGARLEYIFNCLVHGRYNIRMAGNGLPEYDFGEFVLREGDGVCLYVSAEEPPDYRIIAVRPYEILYMEVEKIAR